MMRWASFGAVLVGSALLADVWADIDYHRAANLALLILAALVTVFTGMYALGSRWWSNKIGRVYLAKCIILSLVLLQAALVWWWDFDYAGRDHVRFAIYASGVVAYLVMIVTLRREQRKDRG